MDEIFLEGDSNDNAETDRISNERKEGWKIAIRSHKQIEAKVNAQFQSFEEEEEVEKIAKVANAAIDRKAERSCDSKWKEIVNIEKINDAGKMT